ncbi:hypothetical protein FACS189430_04050 [Bacteroidia bacterium]|nr:hypothetical protein FACS189430_04050 [Bacteroidia bacterium]
MNKIIKVKVPQNEEEFVNLFATVIDTFREAGEDLPEYFDEPNIADDCEFEEIFTDYLQKYYECETEKRLDYLGEKDNFYLIEIK